MLAAFLFFNALLGGVMAAVVLRASPERRENRWLAVVGGIDAACVATTGALVMAGHRLGDDTNASACIVGRILVCYPVLAFTTVFPFGERVARPLRAALLSATAATLLLAVLPAAAAAVRAYATWIFFLPFFALTVAALLRNVRRMRGADADTRGVLVILWAVVGRFALEFVTWGLVRWLAPRHFETVLAFDDTVAVLASYLSIAYAILRHQLFRVRGVLADVTLYGGGALLVIGVVRASVQLALEHIQRPELLRLALVAITAVPLLVVAAARRWRPRLDQRLLWPLDPRRAVRQGTLEQVVHAAAGLVDAGPLVALTREALVGIAGGGTVRFVRGPAFAAARLETTSTEPEGPPESLGPRLCALVAATDEPVLHRRDAHALDEGTRAELAALGADMVVSVRAGDRLYGALTVTGGTLDRDTLLTATALAEHLAARLEACLSVRDRLRLQAKLEEASRLATLGSFAAAIAHDIRTPLTSVQLNVQMLARKSLLTEKDRESFDIALDELRRLDQHVSELLDFAKPLQLQTTAVDLRQVIDEAARRLQPLLAERRLTLEPEHAPTLPLVTADPQRLRQVLMNLIDNAADASPPHGAIRIRTRRANDGRVALDVHDHGKGIAPEHLPNIFEPFFTTRADGTGLGLAIVQKVVRAHAGEIEVRSRAGEGTTFTVWLPCAAVARPVTP